jgi:toxin ParE1/3/4
MKVMWTHEALQRLIEIEIYISIDSSKRAQQFVEYLIEQGETLTENPQIGRIVPELSNPLIRELLSRGYRIVYRLCKNRVDILTVFEGHRLLKLDEIDDQR